MTDDLRNQAGTPRDLFDVLPREYGFTVDACALPHNTKLDRYWTPGIDGLAQSWQRHRVWCNPPFRDIPPWLAKAHEAELAAYLLPARVDRLWWREYKPQCECHYFVGQTPHKRVAFDPPPGVIYKSGSNFLCVLFIFGQGAARGAESYRSGRTGEYL